ncbi:MAG: aspartate dehydrogenase [Chloroflexi bacterium]|nr:aspartate dehydrogenase [Chloroflexota bacterium]
MCPTCPPPCPSYCASIEPATLLANEVSAIILRTRREFGRSDSGERKGPMGHEYRDLQLGIIGYGTIARRVAQGIRAGEAGAVRLAAVLALHPTAEGPDGALVTTDPDVFLAHPMDLVLELASQNAVHRHGEAVLESGRDLLVMSIGALADDALFDRLTKAAAANGRRLLLPSGALGALDAIAAAAIGGLEEVTLTTRKPPDALQTGTGRDASLAEATDEAVLLYDGSAREAVRLYPANVNVAAALSLAGVGFDRTRVHIYADPAVSRNTHEVHARGWFGELRFTMMNIPTENPKTGRITALSVLRTIRNLQAPVIVG